MSINQASAGFFYENGTFWTRLRRENVSLSYWAFQGIETGIFLALAVPLIALTAAMLFAARSDPEGSLAAFQRYRSGLDR